MKTLHDGNYRKKKVEPNPFDDNTLTKYMDVEEVIEESKPEKKEIKTSGNLMTIVMLILVVFVGGLIYWYQSQSNKDNE